MNSNKIALITGATSGIGEATAKLLAQNGYDLIITGRREDRLKLLEKELLKDTDVLSLHFDVRNKDEVFKAIDSLVGKWRNIDVLINNAGLAVGLGPVHEGVIDDWDRMIDTNIKGVLYMLKAVSPLMIKNNSGHIVNISSIAAKEVYQNGNVYCGTKHALDSITGSIRMELLPYHIRVTSINPGMVETEFSLVRFKGDEAKAENVYKNVEPLKGSDVANVILYCLQCPSHMNLHEVLVMPSAQASVRMVRKKDGTI
jgi:3-hydroxy acid dehydrogenase / malonic semialdehyde reductase